MEFHSYAFLIFFVCVFFAYYWLPFRFRNGMLLVVSYYFYMCWKPEFIVLIFMTTAVNYACGLGIQRWRPRRKLFLGIGLGVSLGVLFYYKYFNFFGESLTAVCRAFSIPFSVPAMEIILPVGISFFTFQTLSYTIDVYRGKIEAEKDFVLFALFVSFFPQLVAGPIERAENLLPQFRKEHRFSYDDAAWGIRRMAWGYFQKMVIADRLSLALVDPVFSNIQAYSGGVLALAAVAFCLQIYCDFSGYSDIARGCAKMLGIDLMVNFRAPLLAASVTEFWRKWHISLTDWFRQYVYIPMGGSRRGRWRKCVNTTVTFGLSGLWHGASWQFVLWGLINSALLNLEYLLFPGDRDRERLRPAAGRRILLLIRTCAVFLLMSFVMSFIRAETLGDMGYLLKHAWDGLGGPAAYLLQTWSALTALGIGGVQLAVIGLPLLLLLAFDLAGEREDPIRTVSRWPWAARWPVYIAFLLALLLFIPRESSVPFVYFQF